MHLPHQLFIVQKDALLDGREIRFDHFDEIVHAQELEFANGEVLDAMEDVQNVGVAEFNGQNPLEKKRSVISGHRVPHAIDLLWRRTLESWL